MQLQGRPIKSRTCPLCAYQAKDNRPQPEKFLCVPCKDEHHADVVDTIQESE